MLAANAPAHPIGGLRGKSSVPAINWPPQIGTRATIPSSPLIFSDCQIPCSCRKFPVPAKNFPVPAKKFPVRSSREFTPYLIEMTA